MDRVCEEMGCGATEDLMPHPVEEPGSDYWICHDCMFKLDAEDRCSWCGGSGFFDGFSHVGGGHYTYDCDNCNGSGYSESYNEEW